MSSKEDAESNPNLTDLSGQDEETLGSSSLEDEKLAPEFS
jgi:hypothetical protein